MLSTVSGSSLLLSFVSISPATEKALSDGTSVAGMHKYFFASCAMAGNLKIMTLKIQVQG